MLTFAMKLRALRSLLGLSQMELSQRTDIGQWAISSYERGLYPQDEHATLLDKVIREEADKMNVQLPFVLVETEETLPTAA